MPTANVNYKLTDLGLSQADIKFKCQECGQQGLTVADFTKHAKDKHNEDYFAVNSTTPGDTEDGAIELTTIGAPPIDEQAAPQVPEEPTPFSGQDVAEDEPTVLDTKES